MRVKTCQTSHKISSKNLIKRSVLENLVCFLAIEQSTYDCHKEQNYLSALYRYPTSEHLILQSQTAYETASPQKHVCDKQL